MLRRPSHSASSTSIEPEPRQNAAPALSVPKPEKYGVMRTLELKSGCWVMDPVVGGSLAIIWGDREGTVCIQNRVIVGMALRSRTTVDRI